MADAELRVLRERREVAERDLAKTEAEAKQLRAELTELQALSRATRQSTDLRLAEQHGELTMRKVRRPPGAGLSRFCSESAPATPLRLALLSKGPSRNSLQVPSGCGCGMWPRSSRLSG